MQRIERFRDPHCVTGWLVTDDVNGSKTSQSLRTVRTTHPATQCHIPEHPNPQQQKCESFTHQTNENCYHNYIPPQDSSPAGCCLGWMERWIAVKVWASLCDLSEHNDSRSSSPPDMEPELTLSGSSYAYNELLTNVFIFWSSGGTFYNIKPRISSQRYILSTCSLSQSNNRNLSAIGCQSKTIQQYIRNSITWSPIFSQEHFKLTGSKNISNKNTK
jgi:hypothetical protein